MQDLSLAHTNKLILTTSFTPNRQFLKLTYQIKLVSWHTQQQTAKDPTFDVEVVVTHLLVIVESWMKTVSRRNLARTHPSLFWSSRSPQARA